MNFPLGTIRSNGSVEFAGPAVRVCRSPPRRAAAMAAQRSTACGRNISYRGRRRGGGGPGGRAKRRGNPDRRKLGDAEIIAAFRERHPFKPGDMIRLKPDPGSCICSMPPPVNGFKPEPKPTGRKPP